MKRFCVLVLCFVLVLTAFLPMSVTAASNKYCVSELGLEVTFPEGYTVITRDTPADDPIFYEVGVTKTEIMNQFEAGNIYLNAISDQYNEEIVVTMMENMIENFSLLSDTILDALINTILDQYSGYGYAISNCEIYHHRQAKFIKFYFTDAANTVHGLQYYTVYDGKAINFTMRSYEGSISSRQETAMKTTVDSILFDHDPPVAEEGEDTDPFLYTDIDSGVTFTVPANWKQKEFSEDRELIDVKFASSKESGCTMVFGSIDMWEQMPASERSGYTRSEINNSAFTVFDIAQMYDTTFDKISTVTYNGVKYFACDLDSSAITGDIAMSLTLLVYIDNGWMYLFQFSGAKTHKLYSDFEKLLNSVEYPVVSNVENQETTKPSTSQPTTAQPTTSRPQQSNQKPVHDSEDHSAVATVVVAIVTAIVVVAVVTRKKKLDQTSQSGYSTNNSASGTKAPERTVICSRCGQTLPSDSAFCHRCGTKIHKEQ